MKTERDIELGRMIAAVEVPPLKAGFNARLWERIDAAEPQVVRPDRRPLFTRRRLAIALMTAAVAAVVAVTLVGWPLTRRLGTGGGPQLAVAQVVRNVERSLASSRAMAGTFVYDRADVRLPAGAEADVALAVLLQRATVGPLQRERAARVVATADGRVRYDYVAQPDGTWTLPGPSMTLAGTPGLHVRVVNQPAGYAYKVWRTVSGLLVHRTIDPPAGPPDADSTGWFPGGLGGLMSASAFSSGTVRSSTLGGREVLIVTARAHPSSVSVDADGRITSSVYDRVSVIVDRRTWLPVRVERSLRGHVVEAWGFAGLRPNVPTSSKDFGLRLPETAATFSERDAGYRRLSLKAAARAVDGRLLVPANVPSGFRLALVTVKDDIVSLVYRKGFRGVTVTCRRASRDGSPPTDPFSQAPSGAGKGRLSAGDRTWVTDGALRGSRAYLRAEPLELPRLWARHDGLLVTVAGDLSREELVAIAGSLQTYRVWRTGKVFDAYVAASRAPDLHAVDQLLAPGVVLHQHEELLTVTDRELVLESNGDILDPLFTGITVSVFIGDGFVLWESWNRGDSIPGFPGLDGGSVTAVLFRLRGEKIAVIEYFPTIYWATEDLGERWHPAPLHPSRDPRDTEAAAAAVARSYAEALRAKDAAALVRLAARDVDFLDVERDVRGGRTELAARYRRMFRRPSDLTFSDLREFSGAGWAAIMWTAASPSMQSRATGLTVLEIRRGRIARETVYAFRSKMPFD